MIPAVISFPGVSVNAIAGSQTIAAGGGGVILNGSLAPAGNITPSATTATGGSFLTNQAVVLPGIARTINIFATTTVTNCIFTIVGVDLFGNVITATLVGASGASTSSATTANNLASTTATMTGGADFHIITGIKSSGSGVFSIGTGATGGTNWVLSDLYKTPLNINCAVTLTATTTTYSVQDTQDNVQTTTTPTVFTNVTLSSIATVSLQAAYGATGPFPRAVRGVVSTNATSAGCVFTFSQPGGPW